MTPLTSILVVDDSPADQLLAELAIQGYNPATRILRAADGQEALDCLVGGGEEPDLILLDINMPRMDGHAFLQAYCAEGAGRPIVVMLTTSDQETDRRRATAFDCVIDYLVKPLEAATLERLEARLKTL